MKTVFIIAAAICGHFFVQAQSWHAVETESRCIRDICKGDGAYYALNTDGSISIWDGRLHWRDISGASDLPQILSMCFAQGKLYLAGRLEDASGNAEVAIWDGAHWTFSVLPTKGVIRKIIPRPRGGLYACGGLIGSSIYEFDGAMWFSCGITDVVYTLACDTGTDLYAGGAIFRSGRPAVLKRLGGVWNAIFVDTLMYGSEDIIELYWHGGALYTFSKNWMSIVSWHENVWNRVGDPISPHYAGAFVVRSIITDSSNILYAAINLNIGVPGDAYVARYAPGDMTWSSVGSLLPFGLANTWEVIPEENGILLQGRNCFLARYENDPSSVGFPQSADSLFVYPNPAREYITAVVSEQGKYVITNHLGQICREGVLPAKTPTQIDMKDFSSGLYIIRCNASVQKICIEK